MESTGCYSEGISEFLYNLRYNVSIVNPLKIKEFRNSDLILQKTDKVDAFLIANFCRIHNPPIWSPKSFEIKELYEINKRIESLKIELNRITNRKTRAGSAKNRRK